MDADTRRLANDRFSLAIEKLARESAKDARKFKSLIGRQGMAGPGLHGGGFHTLEVARLRKLLNQFIEISFEMFKEPHELAELNLPERFRAHLDAAVARLAAALAGAYGGNSADFSAVASRSLEPVVREAEVRLRTELHKLTRDRAPASSLDSPATRETAPESSRVEDLVEVKPNVFGIGLNLNALWRWLARRLRG